MRIRSNVTWQLPLTLFALLAVSCAGSTGSGPRDVDVTPTARMTIDAHIGKSMTSDSTTIDNIADRFSPNETVFAIVDVPGKDHGSLDVKWMLGAEMVQEHNAIIQEGVNRYRFRLMPPDGGLKPGAYRLEVFLNGKQVDSESFTVA